jgi:hypothetical protein
MSPPADGAELSPATARPKIASPALHGARVALGRPAGGLAIGAGRGTGRLAEAGVALLAEAGLREAEAARAWQALFGYAVGFPALDGDERGEFDYGLERLLDGIESRV